MQVYIIEPNDSYSGGCALVCADSGEEAKAEYCLNDYRAYIYNEYNCSCNIMYGLTYNHAKAAMVLLDTIYIE